MPETKIASAAIGSMTTAVTDYSVDTEQTDGPSDGGETRWQNNDFGQYLGYYKSIPELKSTIDTKAKWVLGKGYKADEKVKKVLDKIRGFGKDTFNTILQNCVRTYYVGGDSFCEIVKHKGRLINIKPLDPNVMVIVANSEGRIIRYEQLTKTGGKEPIKFKPDEIFHLAKNRFADEIHGSSIIKAVEEIILMRNEAMADMKIVFHRYVKPLWIWQLDTDDTAEVAAFKAKADLTVENAENIYIPKGAAEATSMSVPQFSTLDPLPWIRDLTSYFYQATNTPDVIVGSASDTTEASAKVLYSAFRESVMDDQLFVTENVKTQLNLDIKLEAPPSLIEPTMQEDNKKDGAVNKKPNMKVGTTE